MSYRLTGLSFLANKDCKGQAHHFLIPQSSDASNMSNDTVTVLLKRRQRHGMTLIELMVVVAIIAIIAAIAIPTYSDYLTDSRRSVAQGQMVELSAALERFFSDNNDYTNFPIGDAAGNLFPDHLPTDVGHADRTYDITLSDENGAGATPSANGYTITATPTGSQDGDGDLTLNSRGQRTHDGQAGW